MMRELLPAQFQENFLHHCSRLPCKGFSGPDPQSGEDRHTLVGRGTILTPEIWMTVFRAVRFTENT